MKSTVVNVALELAMLKITNRLRHSLGIRKRKGESRFRPSIPLTKDDLIQVNRAFVVFAAVPVALIGLTLTLGTPLTLTLIKDAKPSSIAFAASVTGALFLACLLPNRLRNSRATRGGFVGLFRFQTRVTWAFWVAMSTFFIIFFLSFAISIPSWVTSLDYIPILALTPYVFPPLSVWNAGKLSLHQFVLERSSQIPNYSWLRFGLDRVEERFSETNGLGLPRNRLFYASSYAIFKGLPIDSTLTSLGDWVTEPAGSNVNSSIEELLKMSKPAEELGIEIVPRGLDRLAQMPWRDLYYALTALSVGVGIFIGFLRYFGIIK